MSHNHHHHHHHESTDSSKNLTVAFWLNAFFVVVEAVGGILTNSIAILSDALHDLGDCASLGIAWWLQRKSRQHPDSHYTYGYRRFSLLGAVFLSAILLVSSCVVLFEAGKRILNPAEVEATGMIWLAVAGILINGSAALRLKRGSSLNERAVYLHILEDVLGWVAVLVGAIVMSIVDLPIIDPIMSIAISLWILWNVLHNLRDTFRIFLQSTPEDLDLTLLKQEMESVDGVADVHDLHVWTHDGESHVMTLHARLKAEADTIEVKHRINHIAKEHNIDHVTIEIERPGDDCNCDCNHQQE